MNTRNILTTKFSKMNTNKQNTLQVSKLLLGLVSLGICFKTACGCYQRSRELSEHDSTTMATLIDTKIVERDDNKNHVIFWLDTDNNRKTAEGHCNMLDTTNEQTASIANLTNGTTKSLAEWRKIAHPYEVQHNPSKFRPSR